jgi:hypothetical protein
VDESEDLTPFTLKGGANGPVNPTTEKYAASSGYSEDTFEPTNPEKPLDPVTSQLLLATMVKHHRAGPSSSGHREELNPRLPDHEEDAGSLPLPSAGRLPPMYNPDWLAASTESTSPSSASSTPSLPPGQPSSTPGEKLGAPPRTKRE